MKIDAHVHLWRYDAERLDWIAPGSVLAQDHLLDCVSPELAEASIDRVILVQAQQRVDETEWLLDLAATDARVGGVIGWTDLRQPAIEARIMEWAQRPKLVGLRHIVQAEPDGFLLDDAFIRGVRACVAAGLAYDILILARQAGDVPAFLDRVGDGLLVLDHGGKPEIATAGWQPWADQMRRIAGYPHVACKLSGLVTEADHANWKEDDIARYMDHLLDCFGPERLIFGSDWPVCRLATSYAQVVQLASDFVERRCPAARAAVFGGNAARLYGVDPR